MTIEETFSDKAIKATIIIFIIVFFVSMVFLQEKDNNIIDSDEIESE